VLTSAHFTDINTFEAPDKVKPIAFNDAHLTGGSLSVALPPASIVVLELK
jgi:alpha-N-arabinofuranosidase